MPLASVLAALAAGTPPSVPISFAIFRPHDFAEAAAIGCRAKLQTWAPLVPGRVETYAWKTMTYNRTMEQSYYRQYGESLFGITIAKKGWDCMRHYEILASGTVPFFVDIDQLPDGTLFSFPTTLVKQAMGLPGMPSNAAVKAAMNDPKKPPLPEIDHAKFDIDAYCTVRDKLLAYARTRLTTITLARYVLASILELTQLKDTKPPGGLRILMLTPEAVGYQSAMLAHGLETLLAAHVAAGDGAVARVDFLTDTNATRKRALYEDSVGGRVYGGGFSFFRRLPAPVAFVDKTATAEAVDAQRAKEIRARLSRASDEYDLIFVTNDGNSFCEFGAPAAKSAFNQRERYPLERLRLINDVARNHPRVVIATVDGSDALPGIGCHEFPQLARVDVEFLREFGSVQLMRQNPDSAVSAARRAAEATRAGAGTPPAAEPAAVTPAAPAAGAATPPAADPAAVTPTAPATGAVTPTAPAAGAVTPPAAEPAAVTPAAPAVGAATPPVADPAAVTPPAAEPAAITPTALAPGAVTPPAAEPAAATPDAPAVGGVLMY